MQCIFPFIGAQFFCPVSWNVVYRIFHCAVLTIIKYFFCNKSIYFTVLSHNIFFQSCFWGSAVPCWLIHWPCFLCIHNAHHCYKAAFIINAAGTQLIFLHRSMIYHTADLLSFCTKFVGGAISISCCHYSFIHSFHWHVQNAAIPCRSQELLPFLSVIYPFLLHFSTNQSSILPYFILTSIS